MNHSFNVEVAMVVGVLPATVFNTIGYWVKENMSKERNCFDGKYWTHNTTDAWANYFPYATKKQIEKALAKLKDAALVESKCFNEDKRDRTSWYTLTPIGEVMFFGPTYQSAGGCISPEREPSLPTWGNDYINNTVSNTVNVLSTFPQTTEEVIDYLNEQTGKHFRKSSNATKSLIHARLSEGYTLDDFKHVIDVKVAQWKGDPEMDKYLQPSTLFRASKFEGYVNEQLGPAKPTTADFSDFMDGWEVEYRGGQNGTA